MQIDRLDRVLERPRSIRQLFNKAEFKFSALSQPPASHAIVVRVGVFELRSTAFRPEIYDVLWMTTSCGRFTAN